MTDNSTNIAYSAKDFVIDDHFVMDNKLYKVTDVGSRVVVAISLMPFRGNYGIDGSSMKHDPRIDKSWQNGPTYALAETVIDEDDLETVEKIPNDQVGVWQPKVEE